MTTQKKVKRKGIVNSDPGKILDLVMCLNDDSCAEIQMKINTYLAEECEADLALLIVVNADRMEASIDAVGPIALQRKMKIRMDQRMIDTLKNTVDQNELLINFPPDFQAILSPNLTTARLTVSNAVVYDEARLPRRNRFTFNLKTFMMYISGNRESGSEFRSRYFFDQRHVNFVIQVRNASFLRFTWPILKKSIMYEYEGTLKQKCQQLLRVARRLFAQVASLDTLLELTMDQAKILTKAEYCTVMLIDAERMELVDNTVFKNQGIERRFKMGQGIVGHVIKTGTLLNEKNVIENALFNPEIDGYPGVDCKTLLCFPIREQTGIIGVGKLINKVQDPYFDGMDEELALAFSIYCGVCITHSVVYQKIREAHIRNALANELVMYHMKVTDSEISRVLECNGYHNHPHLASFHFNPRALPLRELPCYVIRMFTDLGYDKMYKIRRSTLVRFVLYAKRSYRDVPYHNFGHAFNVAQWAYATIVNLKLVQQGYYTDLQAFMFLVAGLTHDVDHRGTTNSFQIQGQTTLAALYSSEGSVMERHHIAQAMCILNTSGCELLEFLPRRDYDRAIMLLRDYILATDLANYFKNLNDYKIIAADFIKGNKVHLNALHSVLMNGADLSDQLKDWGSVKKTAAGVLTEFFKQGDEEKQRGELPALIMDREKCFIPDLEIQFLQNTCRPLYDIIGQIMPKLSQCGKILDNHVERWDAARPIFEEVPVTAGLSVLLSSELDNLIEMNLKEKERLRLEAEAAAAAAAAAALAAEQEENDK